MEEIKNKKKPDDHHVNLLLNKFQKIAIRCLYFDLLSRAFSKQRLQKYKKLQQGESDSFVCLGFPAEPGQHTARKYTYLYLGGRKRLKVLSKSRNFSAS